MSNKKEELIEQFLKLKDSNEDKDIVNAIDILSMVNDDSLLIPFIEKNREKVLKTHPIEFIAAHVNYYVYNGRFTEGLEVLSYYQNAPFISLKVEEYMKELESAVKKLMLVKSKKAYDFSYLIDDLESDDDNMIIYAIKSLSECNIRNYISDVKYVLESNNLRYKFKILIQFVLIEQNVDDEFKIVNDNNDVFYLNPSKRKLPFMEESYIACTKYINHINDSPSVINNAIEVLNAATVRSFPNSVVDHFLTPEIAGEFLIYLSKQLLMEEVSFDELLLNTSYSKEEAENSLDYLTKLL